MLVQISDEEYRLLCGFIQTQTGILLGQEKKYLLETRLSQLLKEHSIDTYMQLFRMVNQKSDYKLYNRFIDLVTTHETSFFRDSKPFVLLQHHLLNQHFEKKRKVRILSAACATGQEVYSLAMVICELLGNKLLGYDIQIHGIDISDHEVARASQGIYSEFEVQRGLPENYRHKYFKPDGRCWKVKDELRYLASFRRGNLLEAATWKEHYDIILCRNVAIYLSKPNRMKLFELIHLHLNPQGHLIIGSTETLDTEMAHFESKNFLRTYYYEKKS